MKSEKETLLEMERNTTGWFSKKEYKRLKELDIMENKLYNLQRERKILEERQRDTTRYFSKDEFNRLKEINYIEEMIKMDDHIKHLQKINVEANTFIIEVAKMLDIETDGIGSDELSLSLDDFAEAIQKQDVSKVIIDFLKWQEGKLLTKATILEVKTFAKEYKNF